MRRVETVERELQPIAQRVDTRSVEPPELLLRERDPQRERIGRRGVREQREHIRGPPAAQQEVGVGREQIDARPLAFTRGGRERRAVVRFRVLRGAERLGSLRRERLDPTAQLGRQRPRLRQCMREVLIGAAGLAGHRAHGARARAGDGRVREQHEPRTLAPARVVVRAHEVDRRECEPRRDAARVALDHSLEIRARVVEAMLALRDVRAPQRDLERRVAIIAPRRERALRVRDEPRLAFRAKQFEIALRELSGDRCRARLARELGAKRGYRLPLAARARRQALEHLRIVARHERRAERGELESAEREQRGTKDGGACAPPPQPTYSETLRTRR